MIGNSNIYINNNITIDENGNELCDLLTLPNWIIKKLIKDKYGYQKGDYYKNSEVSFPSVKKNH